MNEEYEKFYNKILVLFTTIIILFVAFVCFIFVGIAKVDAQSLTFTRPRLIRISSNYDPLNESALKVACSDSLTCGSLTGNTGEHFTHIIYRINQNDQDVAISTLPVGTYKISLGFTIRTTNYQAASSIISGDFNLRIFTTNGSSYQNVTCDTTPKFTADNYPDSSNRIEITYSCDEIKNTRNDITFFGLTLYTDQWNTFTFISSNLKFIDNTDPNQSVIDNQNQNTQDIINNQNQNTQDIIDSITEGSDKTNESLDNIEDSLLDSDTSSSSDSLDNFFGSFNNSDNGGLSAIITAPLVAINKTLDNSCPSLDGTYKGQTFSIPSGCVFWNRIPQVKEVANIISGGFLCYLILRKMFLLIHQLKDPTNDRVEVMNL